MFTEEGLAAEPFGMLRALHHVDAAEGKPVVVDHESEPLAKVTRRSPVPVIGSLRLEDVGTGQSKPLCDFVN